MHADPWANATHTTTAALMPDVETPLASRQQQRQPGHGCWSQQDRRRAKSAKSLRWKLAGRRGHPRGHATPANLALRGTVLEEASSCSPGTRRCGCLRRLCLDRALQRPSFALCCAQTTYTGDAEKNCGGLFTRLHAHTCVRFIGTRMRVSAMHESEICQARQPSKNSKPHTHKRPPNLSSLRWSMPQAACSSSLPPLRGQSSIVPTENLSQ